MNCRILWANISDPYSFTACHVSCLGGCHGAGEAGCVACKEGYRMDDTDGCKGVVKLAELIALLVVCLSTNGERA